MWNKLGTLVFMLIIAGSVSAQTATPTPSPTFPPTPTVDIVITVPRSDMYRSMATAAAQVNQLPEQIRAAGPNGSALPNADAGPLFGYAKWLFSGNTAQELLGRTLAPIGLNLFVVFVLVATLTAIYFLINFIVLILKAIVWIINQILKLIPFW